MPRLLWTVIACSFAVNAASAAETDAFTTRYSGLRDALPEINREANLLADGAVREMNEVQGGSCDWDRFDWTLGRKFRSPFTGVIERFINDSPGVPREYVELDHSVYRSLPGFARVPIYLGTLIGIGFGAHIHHDGLVIGSDKFGHFVDEGYYYYVFINNMGYRLKDVLNLGLFLEGGLEGRWSSGIFSHADLAANYDGYRFWTDALGSPGDRTSSIYFSCEQGRWRKKSAIDLGAYVSAAWDEGMNCNSYRTDSMTEAVKNEIRSLESREKKRFDCPVYPERVPEMIARYGSDAESIINPGLLKPPASRKSLE